MERRRFIVKASGGARGRRRGGDGQRAERHRPAEVPVADVDDLDAGARRPAGLGAAPGQDHRRDERGTAQDPGVRGGRADAGVRLLRRRVPGHDRMLHGRALLLGRQGAGPAVVLGRTLRPQPAGHDDLVSPRRRAQALGGDLHGVQSRPAAGPVDGRADGGLVPKEDQQHRRLQRAQDAHPGPRREDRGRGRRHGRADARRRDLHGPRARRHRLDRMGRVPTTT